MSPHSGVAAPIILLGSALLRGRPRGVPATRKYHIGVRHAHYNGFHVLTEVQFATFLPQVGQKRLNLAEGSEYLTVGREERVSVDRSGGDERCRHVPIANHHSK